MKRIVVTGTHGAGKTTLCYLLAAYFKQQQHNVKVLNETARQCPFPINEVANNNTELWIVHSQIVKELDAEAQHYDAIITDRCPMDPLVYWAERNPTCEEFYELEKTAMKWMEKYDAIFLVEPSSDTDSFAVDAVRATSIQYRNRIRDIFRVYVNKLPDAIKEKLYVIQSDDIFGDFRLPEKIHPIAATVSGEKIAEECALT
ncbi:MAG: ATP-binding protein [Waddliaceae bacterium]|nr:ATP-binding protein [Waddliaceae bacterium]MBT3578949.1 ATP-binding protein [Waddliaceae bacterium]MBT4445492.1 ATP-binding protein [Waddliaceae bacterium]MBT6928983.1 ATP-binding protein [Waddliaceae bacterium]MBT7461575.1 ATP-binding protein [Waddliaceae bacterium]